MGGKSRISRQIAEIISADATIAGGCLVSLFCGTCSVESKVVGPSKIILDDNHRFLVDMLRAAQSGRVFPDHVSKTEYRHIRDHKDDDPALTGFVGFGCSFGGKWFAGYANDASGTNYAAQSKKSLERDMKSLKGAEILCEDYKNVPIPDGAVVYADPPYSGTTGYARNEKFDSEKFWEYMRIVAKSGHRVYISEQEAPEDFSPIWEKPVRRTLDRNKKNIKAANEKLFVYKGVGND